YYVEGIHRYPSYACSSSYSYGYGWGYTPAYGACSNLDYFLRDYPYYYDTRRYQGDRRGYLRQYERLDPRHGFKESPDRPAQGIRPGNPRPAEGSGQIPRRPPVTADPAPQARPQNQGRAPAQGRPSTTRSPSPSTGVRERPSPSGGERRPA